MIFYRIKKLNFINALLRRFNYKKALLLNIKLLLTF